MGACQPLPAPATCQDTAEEATRGRRFQTLEHTPSGEPLPARRRPQAPHAAGLGTQCGWPASGASADASSGPPLPRSLPDLAFRSPSWGSSLPVPGPAREQRPGGQPPPSSPLVRVSVPQQTVLGAPHGASVKERSGVQRKACDKETAFSQRW